MNVRPLFQHTGTERMPPSPRHSSNLRDSPILRFNNTNVNYQASSRKRELGHQLKSPCLAAMGTLVAVGGGSGSSSPEDQPLTVTRTQRRPAQHRRIVESDDESLDAASSCAKSPRAHLATASRLPVTPPHQSRRSTLQNLTEVFGPGSTPPATQTFPASTFASSAVQHEPGGKPGILELAILLKPTEDIYSCARVDRSGAPAAHASTSTVFAAISNAAGTDELSLLSPRVSNEEPPCSDDPESPIVFARSIRAPRTGQRRVILGDADSDNYNDNDRDRDRDSRWLTADVVSSDFTAEPLGQGREAEEEGNGHNTTGAGMDEAADSDSLRTVTTAATSAITTSSSQGKEENANDGGGVRHSNGVPPVQPSDRQHHCHSEAPNSNPVDEDLAAAAAAKLTLASPQSSSIQSFYSARSDKDIVVPDTEDTADSSAGAWSDESTATPEARVSLAEGGGMEAIASLAEASQMGQPHGATGAHDDSHAATRADVDMQASPAARVFANNNDELRNSNSNGTESSRRCVLPVPNVAGEPLLPLGDDRRHLAKVPRRRQGSRPEHQDAGGPAPYPYTSTGALATTLSATGALNIEAGAAVPPAVPPASADLGNRDSEGLMYDLCGELELLRQLHGLSLAATGGGGLADDDDGSWEDSGDLPQLLDGDGNDDLPFGLPPRLELQEQQKQLTPLPSSPSPSPPRSHSAIEEDVVDLTMLSSSRSSGSRVHGAADDTAADQHLGADRSSPAGLLDTYRHAQPVAPAPLPNTAAQSNFTLSTCPLPRVANGNINPNPNFAVTAAAAIAVDANVSWHPNAGDGGDDRAYREEGQTGRIGLRTPLPEPQPLPLATTRTARTTTTTTSPDSSGSDHEWEFRIRRVKGPTITTTARKRMVVLDSSSDEESNHPEQEQEQEQPICLSSSITTTGAAAVSTVSTAAAAAAGGGVPPPMGLEDLMAEEALLRALKLTEDDPPHSPSSAAPRYHLHPHPRGAGGDGGGGIVDGRVPVAPPAAVNTPDPYELLDTPSSDNRDNNDNNNNHNNNYRKESRSAISDDDGEEIEDEEDDDGGGGDDIIIVGDTTPFGFRECALETPLVRGYGPPPSQQAPTATTANGKAGGGGTTSKASPARGIKTGGGGARGRGGAGGRNQQAVMAVEQRVFRASRARLAQELYNKWNAEVFGGKLPADLPLVWNGRLTSTAGQVVAEPELPGVDRRIPAKLELSPRLIDSSEKLRNTLAHEMCHVAVWHISHEYGERHHGPCWESWCRRLTRYDPSLAIKRTHNYITQYAHRWRCTKEGCGKEYGRQRQTIRVGSHVCAVCHSQLQYLGHFDKNGNLKAPKKKQAGASVTGAVVAAAAGAVMSVGGPGGGTMVMAAGGPAIVGVTPSKPLTGFAQFCKENFSSVRTSMPARTPASAVFKHMGLMYQKQKANLSAMTPSGAPATTVPGAVTATATAVVAVVATPAGAAVVSERRLGHPVVGVAAEMPSTPRGGSGSSASVSSSSWGGIRNRRDKSSGGGGGGARRRRSGSGGSGSRRRSASGSESGSESGSLRPRPVSGPAVRLIQAEESEEEEGDVSTVRLLLPRINELSLARDDDDKE